MSSATSCAFRAEADEQLQPALAFYRSVGATRYIREGEALLIHLRSGLRRASS